MPNNNFDKVEACLGSIFSDCLGIDFRWFGQDCNFMCDVYGVLSINDVTEEGTQMVICEEVAGKSPPNDVRMRVLASRRFTWNVLINSKSFSAGKSAWYHAELLRSKLRAPSVTQRLVSAKLGLLRALPLIQFTDRTRGNRKLSAASVDVLFHTSTEYVDCSTTTIQKVGLTSDFDNQAGTSLSSDIQLVQETLGANP